MSACGAPPQGGGPRLRAAALTTELREPGRLRGFALPPFKPDEALQPCNVLRELRR
jgi:hypothetical protein